MNGRISFRTHSGGRLTPAPLPAVPVYTGQQAPFTPLAVERVSALRRRHGNRETLCLLCHQPAGDLFRRQGVECIPAPVEFYTTYALGSFDYLPSPRNLALTDLAIHEYLGLAWYRFRGRI